MYSIARVVTVGGVLTVVLGLVWLLKDPVAHWLVGVDLNRLSPAEQEQALAAAQSRGGAAFTVALGLAGFCITVQKHFLERDKQNNDRLNGAVGHLRADDETARVGGLHIIGRIMAGSPRDVNLGRDILATFLRQHTRKTAADELRTRGDLCAAVTELRSSPRPIRRYPAQPLNLSGVRLPGADLRRVMLRDGVLDHADFTEAVLNGADLSEARLERSTLDDVTAHKITLCGAVLAHASLVRADLRGADLTRADLCDADLSGTKLDAADLTDTRMIGTKLRGTDLRAVIGLRQDQLRRAQVDGATRVPPGIDHPLGEVF